MEARMGEQQRAHQQVTGTRRPAGHSNLDMLSPSVSAGSSPKILGHQSILGLQRAAGNRAVTDAMHAAVQRDATVVQRQQSRRARSTVTPQQARNSALEAICSHPESLIWYRLNPNTESTNNCPATGAALNHYLRTGEVRPAPAGGPLAQFRFDSGPLSTVIRLGSANPANLSGDGRGTRFLELVQPLLTRRSQFVMVHGLRPSGAPLTDDHWFAVARCRSGLVVLDASMSGEATGNITAFISRNWFDRVQWYNSELIVTVSGDDLVDL